MSFSVSSVVNNGLQALQGDTEGTEAYTEKKQIGAPLYRRLHSIHLLRYYLCPPEFNSDRIVV